MMEWRVVPGWPQYEISESGELRRIIRATGRGGGGFTGERKPYLATTGYLYVVLRQAGQPKRAQAIHRLVALAFLPPPEAGQDQVAHADGNRLNNHWSNLRWASRSENEGDKVEHGTSNRGAQNGRARIGPEDALDIVAAVGGGLLSQREIGESFGVTQRTVSDIMAGKSWWHVTGIPKRERNRA